MKRAGGLAAFRSLALRPALPLVLAATVPACTDERAPFGEVVLYVDTDLPVPQMASRLRIDVFDRTGAWKTSRDVAAGSASDWPVSFSVLSTDEANTTEAIVRLRAYRDGSTRDYLGERFVDPPPFQDPWTAQSLDELCAAPPQLIFGEALTLRRGYTVVTSSDFDGSCPNAARSGAVAAHVTIAVAGTYRFEVIGDSSFWSSLFLRTACGDDASEVACAQPQSSPGMLRAKLLLDLQPGEYTLLSTSPFERSAADVTVRGAREDLWAETAPFTEAPVDPSTPRLLDGNHDLTPIDEPEPLTAVDRLVRVQLEPGRVAAAQVVLRGQCLGTMAQLAEASPVTALDGATATTCIDTHGQRVAPPPEPLAEVPSTLPPTLADTFGHGLPCASDGGGAAVCVPGGVFALGGNFGSVLAPGTLPERAAVVSTFWLDRREVTVADLRVAVDADLDFPRLPPTEAGSEPLQPQCNWTKQPGPEDDHPVVCIDHDAARAYCQSRGGDLPTEAQWEYAASRAWRDAETRWPWGDTPPTCTSAVYGRWPEGMSGECQDEGKGTAPVDTYAATDRTPGPGLYGMGGNAEEWTLDSSYDYDQGCWASASLVDPLCTEKEPIRHTLRGGSWTGSVGFTVATKRFWLPPAVRLESAGFRCAYPSQPAP